MPAAASRQFVSFGSFEFDPASGLLVRGELEVLLPPRASGVLHCLVQRPGELVSKEELLETVWEGAFVTDSSLTDVVSALRHELGDDAHEPTYIQTIHRRGYRFIAEVSAPAAGARGDAPHSAAGPVERRSVGAARWLWAAMGVVAIAAAAFLLNVGGLKDRLAGESVPPTESLAVLPLENLSGDPDQEYFAEGMTDELILELAKIGALDVTSRRSVMQFKDTDIPIPDIAEALDVDAVVEGSIRRSGDRVRIIIQLIQPHPERHLWTDSFERESRDILALQAEVARAIAAEIKITLTAREESLFAGRGAVDPKAHDAYLRGNIAFSRALAEGWNLAIHYYEQAIETDPGYAQAHAALGHTLAILPVFGGGAPHEIYPRARNEAQAAIEMDDTIPRAHIALGLVELWYDWDWEVAEREFQRAIELEPGSAETRYSNGNYLVWMGRIEEGVTEGRHALELDPLSPMTISMLGMMLYFARRYDEAIETLRSALEKEPAYGQAYLWLTYIYVKREQYEEALEALQKIRELEGPTDAYGFYHSYVHASMGNRDEAMRTLGSAEPPRDPWSRAVVLAALGDSEEAIQLLEKAYDARSPILAAAKVDPRLDPVRDDPRFQDLLRRMRFPE